MDDSELIKWNFWVNRKDLTWFKRRYGDRGVSEAIRHLMHRERKTMEKLDADSLPERD